jgi:hypothetical protein
LYPCDEVTNRAREIVRLGGSKFLVCAIAPTRCDGQDAVCPRGADVIGAVSDHDGVARVAAGHVQRGTNEVRLVAVTLDPIWAVNRVEVVFESEVANDKPGGFDGAHGDDLQRMPGAVKCRQCFGDPRKHAAGEDAGFIEQRAIDFDRAIDQILI